MHQSSLPTSDPLDPSTSSSTLGKRRGTSAESPPLSPPPPPPSLAVEAQDPSYEETQEDQPPKKKVKKPLTKKVAVWKDIKEWKEGEQGIGRFPVEILDRIISVDSDLDLRAHLALSAVCRYFRTCYREVVFQVRATASQQAPKSNSYVLSPCSLSQVLFQVHYPHLRSHSNGLRFDPSDGNPSRPWDKWTPGSFHRVRGPLTRSLADGRRILSSGRSLIGAGGWFGWGLSREEFKVNKRLFLQARNEMPLVCQSEWPLISGMEGGVREERLNLILRRSHRVDWHLASETLRGKAYRLLDKLEARWLDYRREKVQRVVLDSLGLPPIERFLQLLEPDDSDSSAYQPSTTFWFNPWQSEWREVVSRVVNEGFMSRAEAQNEFKVSGRELLTLKQREQPYRKLIRYSRSAVEALAFRSHGAKEGHAAHLVALASRKSKNEATQAKNGTTRSKPSTTSSLIGPLSRSETNLAQTRLLESARLESLRLEEIRRLRFEEREDESKVKNSVEEGGEIMPFEEDGFEDWLKRNGGDGFSPGGESLSDSSRRWPWAPDDDW